MHPYPCVSNRNKAAICTVPQSTAGVRYTDNRSRRLASARSISKLRVNSEVVLSPAERSEESAATCEMFRSMSRMTASRGPTSEIGVPQSPPRGSIARCCIAPGKYNVPTSTAQIKRSSRIFKRACNLAPHRSTIRPGAIFQTARALFLRDKPNATRPAGLAAHRRSRFKPAPRYRAVLPSSSSKPAARSGDASSTLAGKKLLPLSKPTLSPPVSRSHDSGAMKGSAAADHSEILTGNCARFTRERISR